MVVRLNNPAPIAKQINFKDDTSLYIFSLYSESNGGSCEINFENCTNLTKIDTYNTTITKQNVKGCSALETLILTTATFSEFDATGLNALVDLTITSPNLTSVNLGSGTLFYNVYLGGCALTATSVNGILASLKANCLLNNGTLELSGGTSAAPTGQGITDKADLITAGWTITTN